ncbi:MAG: polyprenyl synthetase family protein [Mariprofundaceae bacterium]|nr:polyprenyl synthetase family protein [Mariprofundaceae bacterium]
MPDISFLQAHATHVNRALEQLLATKRGAVPERLWEAMSYSLLAGGKRIRPALVLECYKACGGSDFESVMPAAMSIESMHTYSLIHDDLPCMDDDDLRRGMATCHRQFDEATAVLAADALQALGFELLATSGHAAKIRIELVRRLAVAAGAQGMVGGQMLDMEAEAGSVKGVLEVERIHLHKTGALICYCCEAGALLAGAMPEQLKACSRYGKAVGLLFQIADDILDATASSDELGKSAGKDREQNKATYVSQAGLEKARELAEEMRDIALEACTPLGPDGRELEALAHYIYGRNR